MKSLLQAVWSDIKQRKNLELYSILFVIIVVFVADVLGVTTSSVLFEIVLAALAVLIYGMIDAGRANERMEQKLDSLARSGSASQLFGEWESDALSTALRTAREICGMSITNPEFLYAHLEDIKSLLRRGGEARFIYVDRDGSAAKMAADANLVARGDMSYSENRWQLTRQLIGKMAESAPDPGSMQVKVIDYLPPATITMLNPAQPDGVMFVTLNAFRTHSRARPSFSLSRETDPKWFQFYSMAFESMWKWPGCRTIDLAEVALNQSTASSVED